MRPKSASPSSGSSMGPAGSRRNSLASSQQQRSGSDHGGGVPGRVRVAVRLRPRNQEEILSDVDFADCVELQPELKRLKLRKNNWDCDTYQFDEVFTETSSQKRVYEVVAKPVVESVCEGYNGTVMAYGQTGTGKTFTLGRLGEDDVAQRGIMVRALEDILGNATSEGDTVTVSYLQLYMETVQDLLAPEKDNIAIVEDPKSGDISVPGATQVELHDQRTFVQLLEAGEANRFAANTKLNTESSRSHAILLVTVKKVVGGGKGGATENGAASQLGKGIRAPTVRKSKLLIVDLAGSERVDKSGSEGHTLEEAKSINLSLTALGKCINALAENSQHVPIRDSKLTRMLRDSFGGTARTSLIVTIGPSPRHRGETASTIGFGQRAMKVENMVKLKEEFDYKSLCWRLETELDRLVQDNERQVKARQESSETLERRLEEAQEYAIAAEHGFAAALERIEAEKERLEREHAEMVQKLEKMREEMEGMSQNQQQEKEERSSHMEKLKLQRDLTETIVQHQMELSEEKQKQQMELADVNQRLKIEQLEKENLERQLKMASQLQLDKESKLDRELQSTQRRLEEERKQKENLDEEVRILKEHLMVLSEDTDAKKVVRKVRSGRMLEGLHSPDSQNSSSHVRDTINGQRATIAKLFEQVGLQKILSLLESEDLDVRIHSVKVIANLAAEEASQEKIVEAGGLGSLLLLLQSNEDETVRRVAAGAVANLAMNETNQELIMTQGGIGLLARTADEAEDPQTLRMVAGAIANLCGNNNLQVRLREEGGIRALLGMVQSYHPDVLAQVARGVANFAKCESRGAAQGYKTGRSLLIDDGALPWIVANANNNASPIRRHIELALCHLAQHEANAKDLVAGGALWELVRISRECSREDIRNVAQRTLNASSVFLTEMKRLQIDY